MPRARLSNSTLSAVIATSIALGAGAASAASDFQFVNIGTAGIGGVWYPTGGFICNLVNKSRGDLEHNIRCTVESTGGSAANVRALAAGDLQVGLVQSDNQKDAWNGTGVFEELGPVKDIRFVMSLHPEAMQIVTRPDTGIESFADLEGRVVNTANPGSGTETTFYSALRNAYDTTVEEFLAKETKLTAREFAKGLCDGDYDAFIYLTGLGSASIVEAATTCGATIVDWWGPKIKEFVEAYPQYSAVTVPEGTYSTQDEEVGTWGGITTLVATTDVPEEVVYNLVKAVFDRFEDLKKQHPAYVTLTRETSATKGQIVPYHPGALKYYREVGLVE